MLSSKPGKRRTALIGASGKRDRASTKYAKSKRKSSLQSSRRKVLPKPGQFPQMDQKIVNKIPIASTNRMQPTDLKPPAPSTKCGRKHRALTQVSALHYITQCSHGHVRCIDNTSVRAIAEQTDTNLSHNGDKTLRLFSVHPRDQSAEKLLRCQLKKQQPRKARGNGHDQRR